MTGPSPALVGELMNQVAPAEAAFRSRWRLSTLARVDAELHGLLLEQQGLYDRALVSGSDDDAQAQADAMVRGWRAACARLEDPLRSDDAYLIGFDPRTAIAVIISEQPSSAARTQVRDGQKVITVTPDEVAKVIAAWSLLTEAKTLFPDAEIVGFAGDDELVEGDDVLRQKAEQAA